MSKLKLILFRALDKTLFLLSKMGINRRTPGALSVYNFFYRIFWPYKNIIEIQGSKMYVNIHDESFRMRKTFEGYAVNRIHEEATTNLFKKVVKERSVVVDLGANIGYFTLLAAKLVGPQGKVFSFEPEPKNFSYLKKNIELNNYSQVEAFQEAVSDRREKTRLYICSYDTGHHTIKRYNGIEAYSKGRNTEERSIEIETVTLDSFLKGKSDCVDVIKMDVEGAEMLVLAGMDKTLRANRNIKMFVEFFPLLIEKMGNSPQEFIRKLLDDYHSSIYIIPDDYDAQKGEMIKINNVEDVMNLCKKEESHINLFLKNDQ
jgi:FkbM family methyltransferase